MFELPPLLLALAFILVGVARLFRSATASGSARTVRLPRDYYVGLDHLINDRFDRAAEIFARMAEVDGDAAEIQFALGSLFRRRGEVDRAIAIHSRLRDHGSGGQRDKAAFALALDYQSAGLMDRAERVLEELAASREYRRAALDHLVRIHEQAGDWAKALKVFHELPQAVQPERATGRGALPVRARRARAGAGRERARAHAAAPGAHPRGGAAAGRHARGAHLRQAGDAAGGARAVPAGAGGLPGAGARDHSRGAAHRAPGPQLGSAARTRPAPAAPGSVTPRQLAWLLATAMPAEDLAQLPGSRRSSGVAVESAAEVTSLRALLTRIGDAGGRYQCDDCGLNSVGWYWRCPKCRCWDSMRPVVFKWAERTDQAASGFPMNNSTACSELMR